MSATPANIDDLVDTKGNNAVTVGRYLDKLNGVLQILNSMKSETVQLENCLSLLLEKIGMEGGLTESTVNSYNNQICEFLNVLNVYQCQKGASPNGIAAKLLPDWTSTSKHTTHKLSFQDTKYRWYRCKDLCTVDNMDICADCAPCGPAAQYPIQIGCSELVLSTVAWGSFTANATVKADAECHRVCVNVSATYDGTDPQDKAANVAASDFTFTVVDSASGAVALVFADPTVAVDYDAAFGTPTVDGTVTGSVTLPVSLASSTVYDVAGTAITEVTFNLSANYTGANTGTELDTVTVTGATLTTKQAGYGAADVVVFGTLLCKTVPDELHLLLSHLDKNCIMVQKCVENVNKLIDDFDIL